MDEIKRDKLREYQRNYVRNRKAVDEEYRLKIQTRTNQYVKEKCKIDEEYKRKISEQSKMRKRRYAEKIKNERINYYNILIANYDIVNGDLDELNKMRRYIARHSKDINE
jgi:hypothetical protein